MKKRMGFHTKWILTFCLVALCGCANEMLHSDFTNYSEIYGDESNKQLLLNLARLANDDPVYFIQLGQIQSQYQVTTAVQLAPGNVRTTPTPQTGSSLPQTPSMSANALTINGQANLGAVQTPSFQFFPLTGSNFVQAVLAPVSDKVYLTFYDQGYPADLVARTMISQVEWEHITTNYEDLNVTNVVAHEQTLQISNVISNPATITLGNNSETVTNYSTNYLVTTFTTYSTNYYRELHQAVYKTNYEVFSNDPHSPTYWKFLDFCANLRSAQSSHLLSVDSLAVVTGATNIVYNAGKNERNPKLADIVAAIQAGLSVSGDTTGNVVVSQSQHTPQFVMKDTPDFASLSENTNSFGPKPTRAAISTFARGTSHGLAVKITANANTITNFSPDNIETDAKIADVVYLANAINNNMVTLKTRTFEGALFCSAKQEPYFQDLEKNVSTNPAPDHIFYTNDCDGPYAVITNFAYAYISTNSGTNSIYFSSVTNGVTVLTNITWTLQVRPSLMLTYEGYSSDFKVNIRPPGEHYASYQIPAFYNNYEPVLCSVGYNGKKYEVTDKIGGDNPNQTVFTMLTYLFAQTAISTQNLPVQQLIQVQ